MDRQTHERLQQINMEEAMKFKRTLIKKEKVFGEEKEHIKNAYDSRYTNAAQKKVLKKFLDSPMYDREQSVLNEKATQQIEKNVEERIKHELRTGRLKPAEPDAWTKRQQRWERKS